MNNLGLNTRLSPDLQELVDTIINSVMALASRVNSNSDSNSLGGTNYLSSLRIERTHSTVNRQQFIEQLFNL